MIKIQIRVLGSICAAMVGHSALAVGYLGFVPTDTNVISPTTNAVVQSWKQVGQCGASAVQISPSWVLSANHAGCIVGRVFKRTEDGVEQSSEVVWSKGYSQFDLHLSRLKTPLPYKAEFVPLASGFPHILDRPDMPVIDPATASKYRATDVLAAGYGRNEQGARRLQVGWGPVSAAGSPICTGPANPRVESFPGLTDGDSGGGMFLVNERYPAGVLAGLMQSVATLPDGTSGFHDDFRVAIESVLSDPMLNPTGERVHWIGAASVLENPSEDPLPETMPMQLRDNFGTGWVTSASPGTLRIQYPKIDFRHDASTDDKIDHYVIRLVHESHLSAPSGYDFSTSVNSFVNDFTIGSGIKPGNWFMTIHGRVLDPQAGTYLEGLTNRVEFKIPASTERPQQLGAVNIAFERQDLGDGLLHWCANLTPVAGKGTPPEGVIWNFVDKAWNQGPWKMPMDQQGGVCDTWRYSEGAATPGELFQVTAQPYNGAAVGPTTTVNVIAPASLP